MATLKGLNPRSSRRSIRNEKYDIGYYIRIIIRGLFRLLCEWCKSRISRLPSSYDRGYVSLQQLPCLLRGEPKKEGAEG